LGRRAGRKDLRVIRRAIPPHGRLLVLDEVVPTGAEAAAARLLDLLMLVLTGGKERTLAEFDALFAAAGFERRRIIPLVGATTLIEASPLP
jgi:hypothetical protein